MATPSFSLAGGTYSSARTVTISCATSGASIFYTLDGKDPTTSSLRYWGLGVSVSASATLKAIATKSGMKDSPVAKADYTIVLGTAAPKFLPVAGEYDSFQTLKLTTATPGAEIYYTLKDATPDPSTDPRYSDATGIALDHDMTVSAIAVCAGRSNSPVVKAVYTFRVKTPRIDLLYSTYSDTQVAHLTCPTDGASILYTTNGDDPATKGLAYDNAAGIPINTTTIIKAVARKSGITDSAQLSSTITLKVAAPSFSLSAASPLNGVQTLSLTCATPEAEIRYTTDGTSPGATSQLFNAASPITLDATKTVRAIAFRAGFQDSSLTQATFTITQGGLSVKAVQQALPSPSDFSLNPYPGTDLTKLPVQMDLPPILAIVPGVLKANAVNYHCFKPVYGVTYSIYSWDCFTAPAGVSPTVDVKVGAFTASGDELVPYADADFTYTATSADDIVIRVMSANMVSAGTYALFVEIKPDYRWYVDGALVSGQTAMYYNIDLSAADLARGNHVVTCVATVAGVDYSCSYPFCKN